MAATDVEGKLGDASSLGKQSGAMEPAVGVPVSSNDSLAAAANASAMVLAANRLKDYSTTVYSQRKPWGEMFDRTAFAKPADLSEAMSRLRTNVSYFRVNYMVFLLLSTVLVMLMNPSSLIVLGGLGASWVYMYAIRTAPVQIGERTLSDREKFLSMTALSVIVVFFLTSVASVIFSAVGLGVAVIAAHGSMRVPDDLFLDSTASENSGSFLSIFTQPAAAQPMVTAV